MITHVINLDRSPERWAYMAAMCDERGFTVRRLPAQDANALTEADVERLAPAGGGKRKLSRAEIACAASHRAAWERIAEGDAPAALVLEDDVYLARSARSACSTAISSGLDFDILKLNTYAKPVYLYRDLCGTSGGYSLHLLAQKTIDASSYLVTRDAARRLLDLYPVFDEAVDILLFDPATGLRTAQIVPAVSVQQRFADFRFLPDEAPDSLLTDGRLAERARSKAAEGRKTIFGKAHAELRRFFNRRIAPKRLIVTNVISRPDQRVDYVRVPFEER